MKFQRSRIVDISHMNICMEKVVVDAREGFAEDVWQSKRPL